MAKDILKEKKMAIVQAEVDATLKQSGLRLEYLELADRGSLSLLSEYDPNGPAVLLIAAYMGEVRLIDNILV